MQETKPFSISKNAFVEAFKMVKANKGTYGIDEQTIEMFEKDYKKNMYKLWNRMSSGSYFPKLVNAVSIPKKNGGTRILGIPTVEDRIAQMVVKLYFEPNVEKNFHEDSYGYRAINVNIKMYNFDYIRMYNYDYPSYLGIVI